MTAERRLRLRDFFRRELPTLAPPRREVVDGVEVEVAGPHAAVTPIGRVRVLAVCSLLTLVPGASSPGWAALVVLVLALFHRGRRGEESLLERTALPGAGMLTCALALYMMILTDASDVVVNNGPLLKMPPAFVALGLGVVAAVLRRLTRSWTSCEQSDADRPLLAQDGKPDALTLSLRAC